MLFAAAALFASSAVVTAAGAGGAGGGSASGAGANVAVFVVAAADDAVERDIAAAVVSAARARWPVAPDLLPAGLCNNGEAACVRRLAQGAGAAYALLVKVAPLGVRDHVVAVQLFDVGAEKALFEESAVQSGLDRGPVEQLGAHLVAAPKAPPARAAVVESSGPGAWTWIGTGLVGAGVVAAAATGIAAGSLGASDRANASGTAGVVGVVGVSVAGALLAGGALAFLLDPS